MQAGASLSLGNDPQPSRLYASRGSRMLVREDKTIAGTIGGGLVEANVMDACMDMLDKSRTRIMEFSLDQEAKAGMDMICGGSLTVWLRSFVPPFSKALIQVFGRWPAWVPRGKRPLLLPGFAGKQPRSDGCGTRADRTRPFPSSQRSA